LDFFSCGQANHPQAVMEGAQTNETTRDAVWSLKKRYQE
jgi:hypothetical protein